MDEDEDWVVLYGTGQLIPHVVEGDHYAAGIVYGDRLQKNNSNSGWQSPVPELALQEKRPISEKRARSLSFIRSFRNPA